MTFVPAANVAGIRIQQEYLGQQVENTLYAQGPAEPGLGDLQGLAEYFANWFTTGPRAHLSNALFLRRVIATDLTSATGPSFTYEVIGDPGGPITSDPLPGSIALCISLRTAFRGRSARGRNYVCGWTEAQVTGNAVSVTDSNAVLAAYANLINTLSDDMGYNLVVVSRFTGGLPRTAAEVRPVTTATLVDRYVDSQRRRLAGRGR